MFKSLLLSLRGLMRHKAEEHTDIRYAGKEHIANVKEKIENVRKQRNVIGGQHLVLKGKLEKVLTEKAEAKKAFQHWSKEGDKAKEDRAFDIHTNLHNEADAFEKELQGIENEIVKLDAQIKTMETDTRQAASALNKAATTQQVGRATKAIEEVHSDLNKGPLSSVIEAAELQAATAQATKNERQSHDHRDVLDIPNSSTPTREELLNN